jgi:3-oxoadipate CoA-transferase alpha subunit
VYEIVPLGGLDPEVIVTPGIFVTHVVKVPRRQAKIPSGGVTRGVTGKAA